MVSRMEGALEGLRHDYEFISTLKEDDDRATLLYARRSDQSRVIVKIAGAEQEIQLLLNEERLLRRVNQYACEQASLFPRVLYSENAEECRILVLSYIPGQSMQDYVESELSSPGIDRTMAVQCVRAVLEQLAFLHSLDPPIIHRDIKPQNVVLDNSGQFHLIDLGISRTGRGGRQPDTLVMGTSLFAPPEQFGYRGTDERSDIYSAGVLLRYCLTQEWDERADGEIDGDLRAVIHKATQFDPDRRYQTAKEMLGDLKVEPSAGQSRGRRAHWRKRFLAFLFLLFAVLLALFLWSLATRVDRSEQTYTFHEPLIEQAVRLQLNRAEGDLTLGDLTQVEALHIF
ncbi:MAG: protein kinase, partial [Clostridia bacterium]|nr:protein kinase [Clostridia bacterium]